MTLFWHAKNPLRVAPTPFKKILGVLVYKTWLAFFEAVLGEQSSQKAQDKLSV